MSSKEYQKYEKEISAQSKLIGIPFKKDVPQNVKTYSDEQKGHWVTIEGKHIFITNKK